MPAAHMAPQTAEPEQAEIVAGRVTASPNARAIPTSVTHAPPPPQPPPPTRLARSPRAGPPGRRAPQRRGKAFGAVVLTVFWGVSIPLYLNARWTRPLWRILPGRNGRDFMVNFPGLRVDTRRSGPRMHLLASAVFATYPLWLW